MKNVMKLIRDSLPFAFLQGFWEQYKGIGGRTHATNQDWNISYDKGMNLSDKIKGIQD